MQKVEGSSPFIRFSETGWKRAVFCFQRGGRIGENAARVSTWVSTPVTHGWDAATRRDERLLTRGGGLSGLVPLK